jgi:hypothetical protein
MGDPSKPKIISGRPQDWVYAIIILAAILVAAGSGLLKGIWRVGSAFGDIPSFVWLILILLFFFFFAIGGRRR